MPVYRGYVMRSGEKKTWVDPEYERRYREHRMEVERVMHQYPNWNEDPDYFGKRSK